MFDVKKRIQSFDWAGTCLGPMGAWPQSAKTAVEIVTDASVPMLLLWGPDGIMIHNDAFAAVMGARNMERLGVPVKDGWPECADIGHEALRSALSGKATSFKDQRHKLERHGAREDVWLSVDFSPVRDDQGAPVGALAVIRETTSRVISEQAQREGEERFHTLADNIAPFAWMADETGSIFWYNKRWFDYTGTTLDEMKGWGWRSVHHPDHVDRVVEKISRCFETGEDWEDTFPLRARDGSYRWFLSRAMPIRDEQTSKVVRWFGTNTDITEHLAEAERNAQLAAIVATSPDAIISLSETGTVLSWNPGAEKIFGYTADEIIGHSERILFPEDADEEFEEKYRHLRHGERIARDTVRLRKDGTPIDVAINAASMRSADGRIVGFSAVITDISERKRSEKHLRVVMRELSHRTKNLLAVIMAMVRQTARSSNDVAVLQSELIQRLQSLSASHDLLVAQDWAGAPVEGLINAVLQPFIGTESNALECEGPSVIVNAVAAQNLGLALHELATNAAKYGALSATTGKVRVVWSIEQDETGAPNLSLLWAEHGGPPVKPPQVKGFGHVVIERVVAQAVNAKVSYEFPEDGVRWSIAIPMDFIVRWRSNRPLA